jgi:hypothetical protein
MRYQHRGLHPTKLDKGHDKMLESHVICIL